MSAFGGSLGFKLGLGWREQQRNGELPPLKGGLYALLQRSGFGYCEFGVGACADPGEQPLLRHESQACRDCGLGVALHPYLPPPYNPAFFGVTPQSCEVVGLVLRAASTAVRITGRPAHLNLHPAESAYEPASDDPQSLRVELLRRSQLFFAALQQAARRHPQVRPVAEHQVPPAPQERIIRVGDTWPELLRVVEGTALGLCWDTGHYLLSVERHGQGERPPAEFVSRVGAVHLHDVVEGADHCVISAGSSRLRDYVGQLLGSGFTGGITLEYSARAIRAAGSFERVVEGSLDALSRWGIGP
jgi:sugar phosphate isomerase/epimerase